MGRGKRITPRRAAHEAARAGLRAPTFADVWWMARERDEQRRWRADVLDRLDRVASRLKR